ncbi:hypothetical protein GO988_15920 [Hymenobacter sp. HMF4947]|uniref:Uncharacterized protein n=1 Tax=Hymenobacter ginkgonis TaxID=2682976 RepID=A0A7K1THD9_9BACT|nr:hypothetical protein [Hymenobacter ginkgonis]MVN77819.1 hypothetical protein [Hymenobacter ginkgonis]
MSAAFLAATAATPARRLALIQFYLPQVLFADGSLDLHWTHAQVLFHLADHTFQRYYRLHSTEPLVDELLEVVCAIQALEPLRVRLADLQGGELTHINQMADWLRLRALLRRVMPQVERLLQLPAGPKAAPGPGPGSALAAR